MTTSIFVLGYGKYFVYVRGVLADFHLTFSWIAVGPLVCGHLSSWSFQKLTRLHQFLSPLSEIYGRSRVIQLSNVFYLGIYILSDRIISYTPPLTTRQLQRGTLALGFHRTQINSLPFVFFLGLEEVRHLPYGYLPLWDFWSNTQSIYRLVVVYSVIYGLQRKEEQQLQYTPLLPYWAQLSVPFVELGKYYSLWNIHIKVLYFRIAERSTWRWVVWLWVLS